MASDSVQYDYPFLKGGGMMGMLTRAFDWSQTPVGAPGTWPQSLRTTVSIVLNSRFPMFLFWGEELTCFYNDAYRPSLGNEGKHPGALGQRGEDCWPEIWPVIKPLIDQVKADGEATWAEDQLIPIYRNGCMEDVYWTFSYSPVKDEQGSVCGVLVVCSETTGKVVNVKKLQESNLLSRRIFDNSIAAQVIWTGEDMVIAMANDQMLKLWGRDTGAIGKPFMDAVPELINTPVMDRLRHVYHTGDIFFKAEEKFDLIRYGQPYTGYYRYAYEAIRNGARDIYGVVCTAIEVTEQVAARQKIEESEHRFRRLIEASPIRTVLLTGEDMNVALANEPVLKSWGKDTSILGRPLLDILPEMQGQAFPLLLDRVYTTGIPYSATDTPASWKRDGVMTTRYFDYTYQPIHTAEGEVYGILSTSIDVTEKVLARKEIEESEGRFRSIVEKSPFAICMFTGREMKIEIANDMMIATWGKDRSVIGRPLAAAVPELEGQPFLQILDDVYSSGITYSAKDAAADLVVDGVMKTFYFNFTYQPLLNPAGDVYAIMDVAVDVTEQVLAQKAVEESERNLRNMILQAPVAMCILRGQNYVVEIANERMFELWGKSGAELTGNPIFEALPEASGQGFEAILHNVYTTGETFTAYGLPIMLPRAAGIETVYVNFVYEAFRESDGSISGVMTVASEVTEQVLAQKKIEEAQAGLRGAIDLAELGNWHMDPANGVLDYSSRMREWLGFEPDEIITLEDAYNVVKESDRRLIKDAMTAALDPESRSLYDVEYTAVNKLNGRKRVIHAQGKAFFNEKGEAYIISGTAQDVTEQRKIQLALEHEVQQRTEELAASNLELLVINEELAETNERLTHSNEELAQYAYVASHDLQEPLRKIRIFSGMLGSKASLPEDHKLLVEKISESAGRMSLLIKDLLDFSKLLKSETLMRPVDLAVVMTAISGDFELVIKEKAASIEIGSLPVIEAVSLQMNQLFYNLLSNALKFTAPGIVPRVSVQAQPITLPEVAEYIHKPFPFSKYHHIIFTDNGIGFETKYSEQIFEVFKRLHARDIYPGSGIGLSLCRRIVANHNGHLFAVSEPGKGTAFHIIIPEKQRDTETTLPENYHWADAN